MDYIELNLLEMLDIYGEDKLQSILSRFMCPQNIDVENFIQTKAIGFARQRLAMTYLVFSDEELPEMNWSGFVSSLSPQSCPELIDYLKAQRLYVNEEVRRPEEL